MNTSDPEGWTTTSEYFKICDDESSTSDTDDDSDSDSDSDSELEVDSINIGMLNGYLKPQYYSKILVEEELLPE
jgi:hypothetical protein